jgi:hypothetical protein
MPPKANKPALISPAAAARKLGIDVRRIRAAIERKQIPSVVIANRKLIPAAAIQRLLEHY